MDGVIPIIQMQASVIDGLMIAQVWLHKDAIIGGEAQQFWSPCDAAGK